MSKKFLILLAMSVIVSANVANAETTIQQIQSPIYTDDIGRSHFLGRGGYSSVRHIEMGGAYTDAVNEVANETKKPELKEAEDVNITDVVKERPEVPVSSKTKATFSAQNRTMDPSASFGQGATYIPNSGVNESKTIYTDDLGRLHFFGKGNLIKE